MAQRKYRSCTGLENNDDVKRDLKYSNRSIAQKKYWQEYKKKYGKRSSYVRTEGHRGLMSKIKKEQIITEEWRRKISENHADVSGKNNPMWGKKRPDYVKEAVSKANKGRKKSKDEIEKLRKVNLGRKNTTETIQKMRLAQMDDKGSNWQGGKTKEHQLLRTRSEYREWRRLVFERDNYTCQICKKHGGYLQADHIDPLAKSPEKVYELDNGRTLCIPCHRKTDTFGFNRYWKNYYNKNYEKP